MQAFPEKYDKGVLAAARDIVKEEGLSYLLTGLGPTVVGYGLEGALKFGSYEACKSIFKTLTSYTVLNFLLASVVAGSIASIVLVSLLSLTFIICLRADTPFSLMASMVK